VEVKSQIVNVKESIMIKATRASLLTPLNKPIHPEYMLAYNAKSNVTQLVNLVCARKRSKRR